MKPSDIPKQRSAAIPPRKPDRRWLLSGLFVVVSGLALAVWRMSGERSLARGAAGATATTPAPVQALPAPAPVLALGKIISAELEDPAAAKKFTLRVPIHARASAKVVVKDVVIEVRFYEKLEGGAVVPTGANLRSNWTTAPVDWHDPEAETLEVEYTLAKSAATSELPEPRSFYGYLVRVYYQDQLQEVAAVPQELNERFPTPSVRVEEEVH